MVYEQAHEDANIIIGSAIDESLKDEVVVTIIVTGFNQARQRQGLYRLQIKVVERREWILKSK